MFRLSQGNPGAGGLGQEQQTANDGPCSTRGCAAVTINFTQRTRSCRTMLALRCERGRLRLEWRLPGSRLLWGAVLTGAADLVYSLPRGHQALQGELR